MQRFRDSGVVKPDLGGGWARFNLYNLFNRSMMPYKFVGTVIDHIYVVNNATEYSLHLTTGSQVFLNVKHSRCPVSLSPSVGVVPTLRRTQHQHSPTSSNVSFRKPRNTRFSVDVRTA